MTGKILIETQEDKRLMVAIELARTVNNLAELLKHMETSISNITINGCHIQTAPGETALYMGNGVKNTLVSNSMFISENDPSSDECEDECEDEYEDECDDEYEDEESE